ncbi:hypothetical protein C7974DRAFT_61010 [Boeremia exigua]|uniref:uncharacterized protein n=1 Tax=Boeremia exigua TaxID=749465 RepID=UPI001E8D71F2|nr:uncharacterized protein C7974DRAFT_61010 [Boeremia exigua]KAH6615210.1 hypothetical protein C7974DRAFT_61010 [Boeremia exigua]
MHNRKLREFCLSEGETWQFYLAARHWPDGLKILLSLSQSHACRLTYKLPGDGLVNRLVSLLVREANWDSLHTLAQTNPRVYWLALNHMCHKADPGYLHDFLHTMHDQLVSEEATTILEHSESCEETTSPSYFHVPTLNFMSMLLLLEAGFVYGDESMYVRVGSTSHFGTPSWIHAFQVVLGNYPWSLDWGLLGLMVNHGARLEWEQPELRTTPAHLIGLGLNKRFHKIGKIYSPLLMQALSCEHFDSCSCACSSSGCLPIGCATGGMTSTGDDDQFCLSRFMTICDMVDRKPTEIVQFALAVLRVLTFDELGLTHTCCRRFIGRRDAWFEGLHVLKQDPEDIEAIRFSEAKDLEALEALMAELERAWTGFSGTFLSYLKLVWLPLIQDTHDRLSAESENETVQRMGQDELYPRNICITEDEEESCSASEGGGTTLWQWLMNLELEDNIGCGSDGSTASSTMPLQEAVNLVGPQDPAQPGTERTDICLTQHDFDACRVGVYGTSGSERKIPERRQSI